MPQLALLNAHEAAFIVSSVVPVRQAKVKTCYNNLTSQLQEKKSLGCNFAMQFCYGFCQFQVFMCLVKFTSLW